MNIRLDNDCSYIPPVTHFDVDWVIREPTQSSEIIRLILPATSSEKTLKEFATRSSVSNFAHLGGVENRVSIIEQFICHLTDDLINTPQMLSKSWRSSNAVSVTHRQSVSHRYAYKAARSYIIALTSKNFPATSTIQEQELAIAAEVNHFPVSSSFEHLETRDNAAQVKTSWLAAVAVGAEKKLPARAMASLYDGIQSLIESRNFAELDALFENVSVDEMPPEALVGLLRYSFSARDELKNWSSVLDNVREALNNRHFESSKLLRGLDADGTQPS